jgi:hypothetical protein
MYWRWALETLGQMIPSGQASRHPLALSSAMHWNVALRVGSTASTGDVGIDGSVFCSWLKCDKRMFNQYAVMLVNLRHELQRLL